MRGSRPFDRIQKKIVKVKEIKRDVKFGSPEDLWGKFDGERPEPSRKSRKQR